MDIQQLRALGAIGSRALVPKTIKFTYPVPLPQEQWADSETPEYPEQIEFQQGTMDAFIRKRSATDFVELSRLPSREHACVIVLRCVCDAAGKPAFDSREQVDALADWLFLPLAVAAYEVNDFGPKPSTPRTRSGATSPSPSGAAPSRNGRKRSRKKSG